MITSHYQKLLRFVFSRQLRWYGTVGVLSTLVDFLVYSLGMHVVPVAVAKAVSFLTATVFSYLGHQIFTFQQRRSARQAARFFFVYVMSLLLNVLANQFMLAVQPDWSHSILTAFVLATAASISFNFVCMKFFVFVPRTSY